jgi:hypothetical protein
MQGIDGSLENMKDWWPYRMPILMTVVSVLLAFLGTRILIAAVSEAAPRWLGWLLLGAAIFKLLVWWTIAFAVRRHRMLSRS